MHNSGLKWSSNRRAYCVHKVYVAHGLRASLYLRDEMTQPLQASGKRTTLEVPPLCAGCMELLLDYIYEDKLELTKTNMLPLLLLARVLRVNALGSVCTAFIREHMKNARQAPFIYALAIELGLEKIAQAAAAIVATHFGLYAPSVFAGCKVSTVLAILSHSELDATPETICQVTAAFIKYLSGEQKLRRADFDALVKTLPSIATSESSYLLRTAYMLGNMSFTLECFEVATSETKNFLPINIFTSILLSDGLRVSDEDSVLEMILSYIAANEQTMIETDTVALWKTCRFVWLSWSNQVRCYSTRQGVASMTAV
eukprot:SAG31_NODE_10981_length_1076_cov_0.894575_1_plen_314_part_10